VTWKAIPDEQMRRLVPVFVRKDPVFAAPTFTLLAEDLMKYR
jgi:hypothetical protein